MDGAEPRIWFLGDLEDPEVRAIRDSIGPLCAVLDVDCGEELPERPCDPFSPPEILILHRPRLTHAETARLERWRSLGSSANAGAKSTRLVLCHGPFVRHAELESCARVFDLLLPEATASETLPRHVAAMLQEPTTIPSGSVGRSRLVEIVSTDQPLRAVLVDACAAAGYRGVDRPWPATDGTPEHPTLTIWDVPVLEPDWPVRMRELCRRGPLIALLGFADRSTVRMAREHGAAACLEVPFHLEDLVHALDRLAVVPTFGPGSRHDEGHSAPPTPAGRSRGRAAILNRPAPPSGWADEEVPPRMN